MKRFVILWILAFCLAFVLISCSDNEGQPSDSSTEESATASEAAEPLSESEDTTDGTNETDSVTLAETDCETVNEESETEIETAETPWNPDVVAYYDIDNGSSVNSRPDNGWYTLYKDTPGVTTVGGLFRAATPLLGTYDQHDTATARQHLYWMAAEGFNVIAVDITNCKAMSLSQNDAGMLRYYTGCYNNFEVLLAEAQKMTEEGFTVPKIYCNLRLFGTDYDGLKAILDEYWALYVKYPDQIYHFDGNEKPFIGIFADWSLFDEWGNRPKTDLDDRFDYRWVNGYLAKYGRATEEGARAISAVKKMWVFVESEKGTETGSYVPVYTMDENKNPECMCASVSVHGGWNTDGSNWDAMNHLIDGKSPLQRTLEGVYRYQPKVVIINRFNYALVWKEEAQEGIGLYHSGHYEPCEELGFSMFNAVQSEVYQMRGITGTAPDAVKVLSDDKYTLSIDLKNYPTEYRISSDETMTGAEWNYLNITNGISYEMMYDTDTVYIQTKNAFGESPITAYKIEYRASKAEAFVFEFEAYGDEGKYRKSGNVWFNSENQTASIPSGASGGAVLFANIHLENDSSSASSLETTVTVKVGATYRIDLSYIKNYSSPVIRLYLDGNPLGGDIDMNNGGSFALAAETLGVYEVSAGKHTLKIEGVSTSCANWEVWLDALVFIPEDSLPTTYIFEFEADRNESKYVKEGNAWYDAGNFTSAMPAEVSQGASLFANLHVDNNADGKSSLSCKINIPATGIYQIDVTYVKNYSCPVVTFKLDGMEIGNAINMCNNGSFEFGRSVLETAVLTEGEHTLVIEAPESQSGKWEVWLDALFFTPVD